MHKLEFFSGELGCPQYVYILFDDRYVPYGVFLSEFGCIQTRLKYELEKGIDLIVCEIEYSYLLNKLHIPYMKPVEFFASRLCGSSDLYRVYLSRRSLTDKDKKKSLRYYKKLNF